MIDWEPDEIYTTTRYLLARWPDGSSLWRYPDKEENDTSIGEVVLGYFKGDDLKDTVELWNVGLDQPFEITQDESVAGDESKITWLLWRTTSWSWFSRTSVEEASRLVLPFFPRILPAAFAELSADSDLESISRTIGEILAKRRWKMTAGSHPVANVPLTNDEISRSSSLFRWMAERGMGEDGLSDLVTGFRSSPCLFFRTLDPDGEEAPYVVVLEAHASKFAASSFVPNSNDRGGKKKGKQSYAVYQANSEYDLLGVGRTVREALLDVPHFVWPGDEAGWAAQLPGGELSCTDQETEIYLLLGDAHPFWWESSKFKAWAEASGIEKRPKSSSEKNR